MSSNNLMTCILCGRKFDGALNAKYCMEHKDGKNRPKVKKMEISSEECTDCVPDHLCYVHFVKIHGVIAGMNRVKAEKQAILGKKGTRSK